MKKKEFLAELEEYLVGIPKSDKVEIMDDYKEHFRVGKKKKRSDENIIKSLGEPRTIARAIRRELTSADKSEFKSEAIEAWVETKRLSKHLFTEAVSGIDSVIGKGKKKGDKHTLSKIILIVLLGIAFISIFHNPFFVIVVLGILGYVAYKRFGQSSSGNEKKSKATSKSSSKEGEGGRNSMLKVILCILFNLFIFLQFWFSLFGVILGLFVTSLALLASSIVVIVFAIFSLISYNTELIKGILLSGLFAGFGVLIISGLLMKLFEWVAKLFFRFTKMYIKFNMRFIKK